MAAVTCHRPAGHKRSARGDAITQMAVGQRGTGGDSAELAVQLSGAHSGQMASRESKHLQVVGLQPEA